MGKIEQIVEKQIKDQIELIQMMGWTPKVINLHPTLYKKMCDYWLSGMVVSEEQKKVMLRVSTYMGLHVCELENMALGGFLPGSGCIVPPVMVVYEQNK